MAAITTSESRNWEFCERKLVEQFQDKVRVSETEQNVVATEISEIDAIHNRNGALWDCIKRTSNPSGGYMYTFRLKDEYDGVTSNEGNEVREAAARKKNIACAPAVEFQGMDTLDRFVNGGISAFENSQRLLDDYAELNRALKELGYRFEAKSDGFYISLPDRDALLARWEILREKQPDLPPFDIISSDGIADDIAFIEAYFAHDVLLSSGKEFIHDHYGHVIPTILLLLKGNKRYQEEKAQIIMSLVPFYRTILITKVVIDKKMLHIPKDELCAIQNQIQKIEAAFSAMVDEQPLLRSHFTDFAPCENDLFILSDDPHYEKYWENRFGKGGMNGATLSDLWNKLKKIEIEYDQIYREQ